VLLLQAGCATPQNQITEWAECFLEREFLVSSTAPGIDIAGSIMAPRGSTRAAVLMITGAGPHTREQRISNTPIYTMIAEHLARRGMVVARSDARGFGASTGPADDEAYNTADRAADNRAGERIVVMLADGRADGRPRQAAEGRAAIGVIGRTAARRQQRQRNKNGQQRAGGDAHRKSPGSELMAAKGAE
jgi:hypothetical protein